MGGEIDTYLHSDREICLSLGWKEDIDSLLGEGLVALCCSTHLNDVELKGREDPTHTQTLNRAHHVTRPHPLTFPPCWVLTAKVKRVDSSVFPGILNWAKAAA